MAAHRSHLARHRVYRLFTSSKAYCVQTGIGMYDQETK